jgi:Cys-rich protein (TIGR01571 family)
MWSTGMCACFDDMGVCCCVVFNPFYSCCLAKRLGENCCVPAFTGNLPLRLKTRYALGIKGDWCNDCVSMHFCGSCATCQLARELNIVGWPQ